MSSGRDQLVAKGLVTVVHTMTYDGHQDMQKQSLRTVLFGLSAGAYLWIVFLFITSDGFGAGWLAPVLLTIGLPVAFRLLQDRVQLAACVTVTAVAFAVAYSLWASGGGPSPYAMAVVVTLTGLLFAPRIVALATVACSMYIIAVGSLRWSLSPLSPGLLAPVLVVFAVGILSSLMVRNLYSALQWALNETVALQHNEEELRRHRGELWRSLKALDGAYQRLARANYDLEQARQAAEDARTSKQRFVTSVSHELRTPLNVIMAYAETMYLSPASYDGVPLPAEYRADIREVYRSSRQLLALANDVIDMAQTEVGRMRIHLEPVALRDVLIEAVEMIRPLTRLEVALGTDLPGELPTVMIDRSRILQVVLNLLNNARRFTTRGSITVVARSDESEVQITVADTGVGIPLGEQSKVFQEFQQLSRADSGSGSGLGLAISKKFVEIHGGRIWLESEGVVGRGCRFHFTLPLTGTQVPSPGPGREVRLAVERPQGRGRTLVLLGEDPRVVQLIENSLKDWAVVPAKQISDVADLVGQMRAQAVVVNTAASQDTDGDMTALCRHLAPHRLPVIACPLVGELQLGQSLGAIAYLLKPVTREPLERLLDSLGKHEYSVLVVDDDPRIAQAYMRMLRSTPYTVQVAHVQDGAAGLASIRTRRPDLVLLDLMMPGLDGYSLLAALKGDQDLASIPVAVVTGKALTAGEQRQIGGDRVLVRCVDGFSNEEALSYLQCLLDAIAPTIPLLKGGPPSSSEAN